MQFPQLVECNSRYSNYIFILDLTHGFNIMNKGNCKARRDAFKFLDLVRLILKILRYILLCCVLEIAQFFNTATNALWWHHNERDGLSNHQPRDCLLNRLFRRRSKKTSKLRVTGLCAGNSPGTGEFPAQRASNAENVSIWWRHHGFGDNDNLH